VSVASLIIEDRGSLSSSEGLEWVEYRELGGSTSSLSWSQLGRLDLGRSQLGRLSLRLSQLRRLTLRPWLEPAVKLSELRLLCLELRRDSELRSLLRSLLRPGTGSTATKGSERSQLGSLSSWS
jgi:hypothetical protein